MNEQPHKVLNFANSCKENTRINFGYSSLQTYSDEPNTGETFNL